MRCRSCPADCTADRSDTWRIAEARSDGDGELLGEQTGDHALHAGALLALLAMVFDIVVVLLLLLRQRRGRAALSRLLGRAQLQQRWHELLQALLLRAWLCLVVLVRFESILAVVYVLG